MTFPIRQVVPVSLEEQAVVTGLGLSIGLSSSTGHEGNTVRLGRQKAWETQFRFAN